MRLPIPWKLMLLAVLIVSLSTQSIFLLGASYVQISKEFGFSATDFGIVSGAFWLTSSAVSAPLGRLVKRIGWQRAIRLNAIGSSVLLLITPLAVRSALSLTVMLMASAVMYGLSNPSANLALAERVDPHRRALIFGLKHAGIPASTLLAGLAVPLVIVSLGWRWAYVTASVLGVVVLALVPARDAPAGSVKPSHDPRRSLVPMTRRRLVAMALGVSLAAWASTALSIYLVAAAVENGYSQSEAGLLLFAGSIASILGRVVAGHVTDKSASHGFTGIVAMAATGAVFCAGLMAASGPLFAILVLAAFATGWGWPGLMTFAVVNANVGSVAESSAIVQAGVFLGAAVSPVVLGWVADTWSFDATWGVVAVALGLSALIVAGVGSLSVAAR